MKPEQPQLPRGQSTPEISGKLGPNFVVHTPFFSQACVVPKNNEETHAGNHADLARKTKCWDVDPGRGSEWPLMLCGLRENCFQSLCVRKKMNNDTEGSSLTSCNTETQI